MNLKAGIFVTLLIAVTGIAFWSYTAPQSVDIPTIETKHLHPLVAEAILKSIDEVTQRPNSAKAWGEFGTVLVAHEFPEQARVCLNRATILEPDEFRWPYLIGYTLEESDYERALSQYTEALKIRPDYSPLRIRIALILMRLGELKECEQILSDGEKHDPDNPYLMVTHGRLLLLVNSPDRAENLFKSALDQPNWSPQTALIELIKLAIRRGDHETAFEYQQQLAIHPNVARMELPDPVLEKIRLYEGLSKSLAERADFALARGDYAAAITAYESFSRKRTDLPTAATNLAQAYAMSGRHQEAIDTYKKVIERFGDVLSAHLGLAGTYEISGQRELAIEQYRTVLKIKPNHKQAWLLLGSLHEQQGNFNEAIRCYQESEAIDPSYPQAQLALGIALLHENHLQQAHHHIARAVSLAPNQELPRAYLRQVEEKLKKIPTTELLPK